MYFIQSLGGWEHLKGTQILPVAFWKPLYIQLFICLPQGIVAVPPFTPLMNWGTDPQMHISQQTGPGWAGTLTPDCHLCCPHIMTLHFLEEMGTYLRPHTLWQVGDMAFQSHTVVEGGNLLSSLISWREEQQRRHPLSPLRLDKGV